jgi:hypothetical protein
MMGMGKSDGVRIDPMLRSRVPARQAWAGVYIGGRNLGKTKYDCDDCEYYDEAGHFGAND